jgi:hypothetical protein
MSFIYRVYRVQPGPKKGDLIRIFDITGREFDAIVSEAAR